MENLITLDEIVKSVLSDQEKYTTHEYLRLLSIANRGLRSLTYDILGSSKVDLIEVSAALRIDLPSDYVDYKLVGIVGDDGTVRPLGMKRNIPLVGTANVTSKETSIVSLTGNTFGLGGGQNENGYYSPDIDLENGQMILTSIAAGKWIYLEYVSNGMSSTGDTKVHAYAEEALIAYVNWRDVQGKRNISGFEKAERRAEYYNLKRLAKSRLMAFTPEEAKQQSRKGFKQSPKI